MKKALRRFIAIIVVLYIFLCVAVMMFYGKFLNQLIPNENLIYAVTQDTAKTHDDIFVIYEADKKIIFCTISNIYITPFSSIKIPFIRRQYIYDINTPANSIYSEGFKKYSLENRVKNNIFIAKDYRVTGSNTATPEFEAYYFGYYKENHVPCEITTFTISFSIDQGYVFVFYENENPNFDDTTANTIYF